MKKVALVTGGNSGLGSEVAKEISKAGYVVYATTQSDLDITSDMGCQRYIQKVIDKHGRMDVLVNCAGITPVGLSLEESSESYLKVLNINTVGAFRLTKEVVKHVNKKNGCNIINISSLNGVVSLPNYGIYSSSKHALEAMSFALRQELRNRNIYVTSILSGAIVNEKKTNLPQIHKSAREKFLILKLLMPFLTKEKVAKAVVKIIKKKSPPARLVLGNDAIITLFLMKLFPYKVWDKLVFYVWNHK